MSNIFKGMQSNKPLKNNLLKEGISQQDLANSLFFRLERLYPDIVSRYGHEVVGDAVMDVADFHAGAEELGTSDISVMVKQIIKRLEEIGLDESEHLELKDKTDYRKKLATLQKIQLDPETVKDRALVAALIRRKIRLDKEAKEKGFAEQQSVAEDFENLDSEQRKIYNHIKWEIGELHKEHFVGDERENMVMVAKAMPNYVKSNKQEFKQLFKKAYNEFYGIHHDDENEVDYTDYSMRQGEMGNPNRMREGVAEGSNSEKTFTVVYYSPKTDRNVTKTVRAESESKIWNTLKAKGIEVVSVREQGVEEDITPNTIHKLADRAGVKWDNEPSFLRLTKRLTGKKHLDDLDQTELQKVKKHLERKSVGEGTRDLITALKDKHFSNESMYEDMSDDRSHKYEMVLQDGRVEDFNASSEEEAKSIANSHGAKSLIRIGDEVQIKAAEVKEIILDLDDSPELTDEGQIYSTGGGAGQAMRWYRPKDSHSDKAPAKESSIMKGLQMEGDDEEYHTGGSLGTPYPGTYEQETAPLRRRGSERTLKIAFEGKKNVK